MNVEIYLPVVVFLLSIPRNSMDVVTKLIYIEVMYLISQ